MDTKEVLYRCVYCGKVHRSHNGTGSDVACCSEVGHVIVDDDEE
jgi:hypothetical protein